MVFNPGQLVYFYRRGRSSHTRTEPGWHGPARMIATEKQGDEQRNNMPGSIVWIVHATILYRCAPEPLRAGPESMTAVYQELHGWSSPLEDVRQAGNQANYRDISQEISDVPPDAEIHDTEPGSSRAFPSPSVRVFGKQSVQHGPQNREERVGAQSREEGQSSASQRAEGEIPAGEGISGEARRGTNIEREVQRPDMRDSVPQGSTVHPVNRDPSTGEREVLQPDHLRAENGPEHERFWQWASGRRDANRASRGGHGESLQQRREVSNRDTDRGSAGHSGAPPEPSARAGTGVSANPRDAVPDHRPESRATGAARGSAAPPEPSGEPGQSSDQVSRSRSRPPHGARTSNARSVMFEDRSD